MVALAVGRPRAAIVTRLRGIFDHRLRLKELQLLIRRQRLRRHIRVECLVLIWIERPLCTGRLETAEELWIRRALGHAHTRLKVTALHLIQLLGLQLLLDHVERVMWHMRLLDHVYGVVRD